MRRFFLRLRIHFRRILQLDDTPESIARGTALGIFIAMTPTVGIQMILVAVVHTLCKANRIAGLIMVYISNPLTMIPIYWVDYAVGWLVLRPFVELEWHGYEHFSSIFDLGETEGLGGATREFMGRLVEVGTDVAGPLFLGGLVVGTICALPSYPITLGMVRRTRSKLKERRLRLSQRLSVHQPATTDAAAASAAPRPEAKETEAGSDGPAGDAPA